MRTFLILSLVAVGLAGCLELDFSRTNGNQKADDAVEAPAE